MSRPVVKQWRCKECREVIPASKLLQAPSPFDDDDLLVGCPHCKQCNDGFALVCDEPGCQSDATCGFPTKAGYRNTCSKHWKREARDE